MSIVACLQSMLTQALKLASVPDGGLLPTVFVSDEIDLMTVADVPFGGNWPSLPGFKVAPLSQRWVLPNVAATTFSAGPTAALGNDSGVFVNILSATANFPAASTLNTFLANGAGGPYLTVGNTSSAKKLPDLTTSPTIRVSIGDTGTAVTSCKGRLLVMGLVSSPWATI